MSNFPFDKQIIAMFIFITLFCVMSLIFTGCQLNKEDTKKPLTFTDSVTIMKDLGTVLGCAFAPEEPICIKDEQIEDE
jgi:hypothetical protein